MTENRPPLLVQAEKLVQHRPVSLTLEDLAIKADVPLPWLGLLNRGRLTANTSVGHLTRIVQHFEGSQDDQL